ncbi:hypothetical protein H4J46_14520 [Colwellia sp. MB02u-6]|uniref:hypothetical protein n=1 Tax=Colwellia sp. MB02u-6 TaxID=2759824 RepID=UPI0015F469B1|nr:hypothetical protein [Colwellia sp. MB02u-6]MBA6329138.1 hypothetical protein [Colwellia sp. MB02u-6]
MKRIMLSSLMLILLCASFLATAGKKHCQDYRQKLDNIQAQQRQANTHKRSHSLSSKAAKARDRWWRCETGKLKAKAKAKSKSKREKKSKQKPANKKTKNKTHSQSAALKLHKNSQALVPFASHNPLVIRSKYQGEKLRAWLIFYQPAKKCARPKSLQHFALCIEDKRSQQTEFEKSY